MNKLTFRQYQILELILKSEEYTTANELADYLAFSIRTIKTDISTINKALKDVDAQIISKTGKGYRFEKGENFDDKKLDEICPQQVSVHVSNSSDIYTTSLIHTIKKLLVVDYHVKLEELADELYISRTMMTQIMREIRVRLENFNLKVVSRPNYGILVEGSEIDKRLAISEYFYHDDENTSNTLIPANMIANDVAKDDYERTLKIVKDATTKYNLDISDFSLHNLVIHISISIRRCQFYNYVVVDDNIVREWQNTIEFKTALEIIKEIESYWNFMIPIGEAVYLAQHLSSKRIIDSNHLTAEEENKLNRCLEAIMAEVNNNFGLTLNKDSDWYNYMYLHIPCMIERLKTHLTIRNPLVKENMRRYLFATKITHSACEVIQHFYNVKVDLNEFGYLLLYFNLAVNNFELDKPINIAILSGRGRPELVMIANEIKERFSSRKYNIKEVRKLEKDYDLVISTYQLDTELNCPVVMINDDNYIEKIREKINEIRFSRLDIAFFCTRENCSFNLDGNTKEEVLNNLYIDLKEKGIIKELPDKYSGFHDDEIGNGIIHFQDAYRIVKKDILYVCTLKKPVYWNKEMARILIITKTKKEHDKDLYNLCRVVSKWTSNPAMVNRFLKNQNYDDLMEDLKDLL